MDVFRKDYLLSNARETSGGIVLTWTPEAQQQMIMSNLAAKEWITEAAATESEETSLPKISMQLKGQQLHPLIR